MKVGDYVKYKYEDCIYIGKIKFISEVMGFEETLQFDVDNCIEEILKEEIIKSSPNIIDLIEVGDYVNGVRVDFTNIDNKLSYEDKCIGFYDGDGDITLFENDIKSIVTKEQFSQMEYKVGEIDEL